MASSDRTTRSKKQVRFSPQVLARRTWTLSHYTEDEIDACWYTEKDYSRIRRDVIRSVRTIEERYQGKKTHKPRDDDDMCEGDDVCTRGLEHRTRHGAKLRLRHRRCAFEAVFSVQDLQYQENRYDENEIASIYFTTTLQSRAQAYMIGLADNQNQISGRASSATFLLDCERSTSCCSASTSNNLLPATLSMISTLSSSPPKEIGIYSINRWGTAA